MCLNCTTCYLQGSDSAVIKSILVNCSKNWQGKINDSGCSWCQMESNPGILCSVNRDTSFEKYDFVALFASLG